MPLIAFVNRGQRQRHQWKQQGAVSGVAGADTPHQSEIDAKGNHWTEQCKVEQRPHIAHRPLRRKIIAAQQGHNANDDRAIEHRPGVGGQCFQAPALVAQAQHIAQRKAVGTQRAE